MGTRAAVGHGATGSLWASCRSCQCKSHIVVSIPSRAWHEASLRSGCSARLALRHSTWPLPPLAGCALVTGVQWSQPIVAAVAVVLAFRMSELARGCMCGEGARSDGGTAHRDTRRPDSGAVGHSPRHPLQSVRSAWCRADEATPRAIHRPHRQKHSPLHSTNFAPADCTRPQARRQRSGSTNKNEQNGSDSKNHGNQNSLVFCRRV